MINSQAAFFRHQILLQWNFFYTEKVLKRMWGNLIASLDVFKTPRVYYNAQKRFQDCQRWSLRTASNMLLKSNQAVG